MSRKKAEDIIIKYINKIYPNGKAVEAYKEKFKKMSDKEFKKFMEELRDGKRELVVIAPPYGKSKLSTEKNISIAKELGYTFHQHLWIGPTKTLPKYKTPVKYLVLELPYKRAAQTLTKKISVPSTSRIVDTLTGQPAGSSKGAAVTYPELMVLSGMGLDKSIEELIKYRGGDKGGYQAFLGMADANGIIRQESIKLFATDVSSKTSLKHYLQAALLRNNL